MHLGDEPNMAEKRAAKRLRKRAEKLEQEVLRRMMEVELGPSPTTSGLHVAAEKQTKAKKSNDKREARRRKKEEEAAARISILSYCTCFLYMSRSVVVCVASLQWPNSEVLKVVISVIFASLQDASHR